MTAKTAKAPAANANLFAALRGAFPADLDATAIETADGPGAPAFYTWRDLDHATARIANLLDSLGLPAGRPRLSSRFAMRAVARSRSRQV